MYTPIGQAAATSSVEPLDGKTIALVLAGGVKVGTAIHVILQSQVNSLEVEASLIELNSRIAEIEAAGRDFLMVSKSSDEEDLEAFISKFSDYGFMVEEPVVRNVIRNKIMELEFLPI